ncbi:MAG: colanic acid biosynthesis glycosyltransferase WcaL [Candidatus Hydrogenedentota bacterium]|nr:MAG: colanic acid biosynthesis glycosyltransferase WcaL [Candidatus Hydrogenedentota bacterium]
MASGSVFSHPIHVVHNCATWLPITENWLYNLIRSLPESIVNHVVCVQTANLEMFPASNLRCLETSPSISSAVRVIHESITNSRMMGRRSAEISEIIPNKSTAILHSHFGPHAWRSIHVARQLDIPHIASFYGFDATYIPQNNAVWKQRYAELFDTVNLVLAEGAYMRDTLISLGCPSEKVVKIHLGVPLEEVEFIPRAWSGTGPIRILMASAFREKKGIPYGLMAIAKLRKQYEIEVTIIGDAGDPEEKKIIEDTIRREGLTEVVSVLGFQPFEKLMEEAYDHHIYLAPSVTAANGDAEGGLPYSLIVMAASGMLCVASAHCDIPELIKDGKTGMLADERDVDGIVTAISSLVDKPCNWEEITYRTRQHIENEFNLTTQAQQVAILYQQATTGIVISDHGKLDHE